jgi:hypothetical protein
MGIHLNLNPMLDVYNSYNISIWLQSSVYYCNHKFILEAYKLKTFQFGSIIICMRFLLNVKLISMVYNSCQASIQTKI